jgi:hypothetical protein
MPQRRYTYQDMLDSILLEMSANHPSLTSDEETHLKQALMDIMADEQGWLNEPDSMVHKFDTAMNTLRALRARRPH